MATRVEPPLPPMANPPPSIPILAITLDRSAGTRAACVSTMCPDPPDREPDPPLHNDDPPGRSWQGAHHSIERRELSRSLRRNTTPAERSFWERVRARQCDGLKWRRQHPIGPFVADFYCRALALVVELDGQVHADTVERDRERDAYFAGRGLRVVRIENCDWLADPDRILAELCAPGISSEP